MDDVPGVEVVPLGWCIEAMYRSFERSRNTGWDDPVGAYAAVAETLFWIDVVDNYLRKNHHTHYEATLADQPEDIARMLAGLLSRATGSPMRWTRSATSSRAAKGPAGFAANWTWQSLPPRPRERQQTLHRDDEAVIVGRDVVGTLLVVTVFLGQVRNRMWQNYRKDPTS